MEENEIVTTSAEDNAAGEPVCKLAGHQKRVKRPPASFSDGGFAAAAIQGKKAIVGNKNHGKPAVSVVKKPPKPPLSSSALVVQNKMTTPSGNNAFFSLMFLVQLQ